MGLPVLSRSFDQQLIFQFFWKFSAMECALKRSGFLQEKVWADADWNKFAAKIGSNTNAGISPDFDKAIAKLIELSPQRQTQIKGQLGWKHVARTAKDTDVTYAITLLKTARNNLFHGGKFPGGLQAEVARDHQILRAALAILDGCYDLCPEIHRTVEEVAA